MMSEITEGHARKDLSMTPKQVPSQATEWPGNEVVKTGKPAGEAYSKKEPTTKKMECGQEKQYQEIPKDRCKQNFPK